ncbi:hypothetical protein ADUPG1_013870, partial [Aduncisulcus paluster]
LRETKNSLFEGEENGRTVAESSLDIRKLFFSSTCSRFESGCSSATSDTLYSENTIGILGSLLDKSYVTAITLSQYHSIYSVGGSEDIDIIADSYPYWFLNNVVPYDVIGGSSRVIALIYDHILDQQVSLWVIIVVSIVLVSLFLNFVLIYAALSVYPTIEEQRAIILLLWRHIPIKKIPSEHILFLLFLSSSSTSPIFIWYFPIFCWIRVRSSHILHDYWLGHKSAPQNVKCLAFGVVRGAQELGFAYGTALSVCIQDIILNNRSTDDNIKVGDVISVSSDDFAQSSMVIYFFMGIISLFSLLSMIISPYFCHEIDLKGYPEDQLAENNTNPKVNMIYLETNARKYYGNMGIVKPLLDDGSNTRYSLDISEISFGSDSI